MCVCPSGRALATYFAIFAISSSYVEHIDPLDGKLCIHRQAHGFVWLCMHLTHVFAVLAYQHIEPLLAHIAETLVRVCMHGCINKCRSIGLCVCMSVCMCVCVYICMCMYGAWQCVHIFVFIRNRTYLYAHTYTIILTIMHLPIREDYCICREEFSAFPANINVYRENYCSARLLFLSLCVCMCIGMRA